VKASYLSLEEPEPTWKMLTSSIFLQAMRQAIFQGKIFKLTVVEKNNDIKTKHASIKDAHKNLKKFKTP
jgi:hypothetical protein